MPKPTRVRRAPNRDPTSLAVSIPNPDPDPIVDSPLNPLIDPQLLILDVDVDVDISVNYSPFLDAIPSPPPNILSLALGSIQSDPFEQRTILDDS
jgi:hypothetical protein